MTPVRCVCGAKAVPVEAWPNHVYVSCTGSAFCWGGSTRKTEAAAIAAWNAVMVPATTAKVQAKNLRKLGKK